MLPDIESLKFCLETYVCRITFTKKDGDVRSMLATRNAELITEDKKPKGSDKADNPDVLPVMDLELNEWRSFRLDSLLDWYIVIEDPRNAH